MNRLLTTLLVWFLMAALPLHAVAAAVKLSCAPAGGHPVAAAAAGHSAHRSAEHAADHSAHAADDAHAHHGGPAVDGDPAQAGTSDLSHSSCSACSVFCVGAVAPPSSALSLPSFDGSEALVIAPGDFATGFIPEGLQRPPRR